MWHVWSVSVVVSVVMCRSINTVLYGSWGGGCSGAHSTTEYRLQFSERSIPLSAATVPRTLASEALVHMLVQQVLAAWRTATAGRPKGEDLYSPRKDLGADLHSDFPS